MPPKKIKIQSKLKKETPSTILVEKLDEKEINIPNTKSIISSKMQIIEPKIEEIEEAEIEEEKDEEEDEEKEEEEKEEEEEDEEEDEEEEDEEDAS